jgi:hypothetical protein
VIAMLNDYFGNSQSFGIGEFIVLTAKSRSAQTRHAAGNAEINLPAERTFIDTPVRTEGSR